VPGYMDIKGEKVSVPAIVENDYLETETETGRFLVLSTRDPRLSYLQLSAKKITWGGQVRENPVHLTPYE